MGVGDIREIEPNINAGAKYVRLIIDTHFANEPMDRLNKGLFAFASYNAGPARIHTLRAESAKRGYDPNKWFRNVELIVAERVGQETVTYVAHIHKYYIAYRLLTEQQEEERQAREALGKEILR
jgi:membrane-bound lytic murein transglycosylase MltF